MLAVYVSMHLIRLLQGCLYFGSQAKAEPLRLQAALNSPPLRATERQFESNIDLKSCSDISVERGEGEGKGGRQREGGKGERERERGRQRKGARAGEAGRER